MFKYANTNDTNTQAMTEVALGLSMAFFSLLILALISMGAGKVSSSEKDTKQVAPSQKNALDSVHLDEKNSIRLSNADSQNTDQSHHSNSDAAVAASQKRFLFYFDARYFDANLREVNNVQDFAQQGESKRTLIVAVSPQLSFEEVMLVHKDFAQNDIQISAMDSNWLSAIQKKFKRAQ